jgi:transposase
MRGDDILEDKMFSYLSPNDRVPTDHPLRSIRKIVDTMLREMSDEFQSMYSRTGRPSIPPEKLLRALLLQVFYTVRSERLLMEQLEYNMLFRWFVGLSMDDKVWDHSTFSKNRQRFIDSELSGEFFKKVRDYAQEGGWLSDEHFTVDGTLIEAWASQKSFQPKDTPTSPPEGGESGKNVEVDFKGTERTNDTHESKTDRDARLYKKAKGTTSQLCYIGHVAMENRNGLVIEACLTKASGTAEREAAVAMVSRIPGSQRITVGADKAYDVPSFAADLRELKATPHVAQKRKGSAIDSRTTRHAGYQTSQKLRKRIEEIFGWAKTIGMMRKTRHRGTEKVGWVFEFTMAAYNLVRIRNLEAQEAI